MIASSNECYELEQMNDSVENDDCWTFPKSFVIQNCIWKELLLQIYLTIISFSCLNTDASSLFLLAFNKYKKKEFVLHGKFCSVVTMHLNNLFVTHLTPKVSSDRCHWYATRSFYTQCYCQVDLSFRWVSEIPKDQRPSEWKLGEN